MDMPGRVLRLFGGVLFAGLAQKGQIFVGRLRDDVEIQALGALRLLVHEQRQALVRRVAQPFLDR